MDFGCLNGVLVVGYCSVSEKLEGAIVLFPRKASEIVRAFDKFSSVR